MFFFGFFLVGFTRGVCVSYLPVWQFSFALTWGGLLPTALLSELRHLAMFPSQLVWLKSAFIVHDKRGNGLSWAVAQELSPHHMLKTAGVYTFMHAQMWINGTSRRAIGWCWEGGWVGGSEGARAVGLWWRDVACILVLTCALVHAYYAPMRCPYRQVPTAKLWRSF